MSGWIDDADLPKLQSIELGGWVFEGDGRDNRKGISNKPYNFRNSLTMRSGLDKLMNE